MATVGGSKDATGGSSVSSGADTKFMAAGDRPANSVGVSLVKAKQQQVGISSQMVGTQQTVAKKAGKTATAQAQKIEINQLLDMPESSAMGALNQTNMDAEMPLASGGDAQHTGASLEPPRLYCLCRTSDENDMMIGCDKCDEWYHPACVNLDTTLIPDMDAFEFTCPPCKLAEEKRLQKLGSSKKQGKDMAAVGQNKRTAKAN